MGFKLGHALEAFVRGRVRFLAAQQSTHAVSYLVSRELPVSLTMDTDIVVTRKRGASEKPLCLCAVFHSLHVRNSDMKWKRSRQEYVESELLHASHPSAIDPAYHTVMCLFGRGWKRSIFDDFRDSMPPAVIVADHLSACEETELFDDLARLYSSFKRAPKERTEEAIAAGTCAIRHSAKIDDILTAAIWGQGRQSVSDLIEQEVRRLRRARPFTTCCADFRSRFNHSLSLLALFSPDERASLYSLYRRRNNVDVSTLSSIDRAAILRGGFLGIVRLLPVIDMKSGKLPMRHRLEFHRRQTDEDFELSYAFEKLKSYQVEALIGGLHRYASACPRPYGGAVSAMRMSNWELLATLVLPWLQTARAWGSGAKSLSEVRAALTTRGELVPDAEVWNGVSQPFQVPWSIAAVLTAISTGDANVASRLDYNRAASPSAEQVRELVALMARGDQSVLIQNLDGAVQWLEELRRGEWAHIAARLSMLSTWATTYPLNAASTAGVPEVLNLFVPGSWLWRQYNVIATHPVFSPALLLLYEQVALPESGADPLLGWPAKRSAAISDVIPGHAGRKQFSMLRRSSNLVVGYEAKTITKNNLGNKAKELLDRVGELKRAADDAGLSAEAVLLLDGDIEAGLLSELSAPGRYDRIYSFDELLHQWMP